MFTLTTGVDICTSKNGDFILLTLETLAVRIHIYTTDIVLYAFHYLFIVQSAKFPKCDL